MYSFSHSYISLSGDNFSYSLIFLFFFIVTFFFLFTLHLCPKTPIGPLSTPFHLSFTSPVAPFLPHTSPSTPSSVSLPLFLLSLWPSSLPLFPSLPSLFSPKKVFQTSRVRQMPLLVNLGHANEMCSYVQSNFVIYIRY